MDSKNTQDLTLEYYAENTKKFIGETVSVDMSFTTDRFLKELPPKARILDLGCGSGRDTKTFLDLGYAVDAVDGSEELCKKASELTGIQVRHMYFQDLDADSVYDGIWASASILHLTKAELEPVLHKIAAALKPGGVLFTSFKYGDFEGIRGGRFYSDFTDESLKQFFRKVPELQIFSLWMNKDSRPDREEHWVNILARRVK